jgi:putative photosynthetic complex assembly protein
MSLEGKTLATRTQPTTPAAKIPRAALLGAAFLVGFTLLAVFGGKELDIGTVKNPEAAVAVVRELRFEDRENGALLVFEAPGNELVYTIEPGSNSGFVRGVLRGFARERHRAGVGIEPPFLLSALVDGRMFLEDPETGRRVPLDGFGRTNAESFARILRAKGGTSS